MISGCHNTEVTKNIGKYMDRCDLCQRMKNHIETLTEKLIVNEVSERLWTHLTVDFITKLLLIAEKNVILVVYNRLSKITYFVATIEETFSQRVGMVV